MSLRIPTERSDGEVGNQTTGGSRQNGSGVARADRGAQALLAESGVVIVAMHYRIEFGTASIYKARAPER
jgi:hypothetical protein